MGYSRLADVRRAASRDNAADPRAAETRLPGTLARAWRAAANILNPPDPPRHQLEREAREVTAIRFEQLIARAQDPPGPDQPGAHQWKSARISGSCSPARTVRARLRG